MHTLVLTTVNLLTKFEVANFTHSKHMMGPRIQKGVTLPDHTHLGIVCHVKANT